MFTYAAVLFFQTALPMFGGPAEDALERGEYLTHEDVGRRLGRFLDP